MTNLITAATLAILLIVVIFAFWKSKKRKIKGGGCEHDEFLKDDDWKRNIPTIKCIQCGKCQIASNNCCVNCLTNQQYIYEKQHCHHHEHSNYHHHHFPVITDIIFTPLLLVLVLVILVGWVFEKLWGNV